MAMLDKINEFVDTMISEGRQFETMQTLVAERVTDVQRELTRMKQSEETIFENLNQRAKDSGDENINAIFKETAGILAENITNASEKIEQSVGGLKFIQDFENQFTVSVFGKVKAGKSYLGNFIMGQTLREEGIASSYDKLGKMEVFVYDRGKQSTKEKLECSERPEEQDEVLSDFYVDKSEATSTIQWVKIGGMCWFDTPGIGSITLENEELAEKYVKNSDLVIFASNSDAAGTKQEFSEIRKLREMEKPLLLLLTMSDTYELDVDENGDDVSIPIPKSEEDRHSMEQYVLETLREEGMEDVLKYADIMTISVMLANEAIRNKDEKMFADSNLGILLDKLIKITRDDAAEMKKRTPANRINEMIRAVTKDLDEMRRQIQDKCEEIGRNRQELEERKDWIVQSVYSAVSMRIQKLLSEEKEKVEKGAGVVSGKDLADRINQIVIEEMAAVCMKELSGKLEGITSLDLKLQGIGDLKMKQESIDYTYSYVTSVDRKPKGLWENVCSLFGKTYSTTTMKTEVRQSVFDVGTNDSEVANQIMLELGSAFGSTVDNFIGHMIRGFYDPVEQLERRTVSEINGTIKTIQGMML